MATLNTKTIGSKTFEGGPAVRLSAEKELRRSVLSCLLWEKNFYESGIDVADRIINLTRKVTPEFASALAVEARTAHGLRHAPLLILRALAKTGNLKADVLAKTISRVDELTEFLAIYWKDAPVDSNGRRTGEPVSRQVRLGLAQAFGKFDEYQLAKYNRSKSVKLRDVLRITHAKPKDETQRDLWGRLIRGELKTPDTWEVALSGGEDKQAAWIRLLAEKKLGGMALIRNLRNMEQENVPRENISAALSEMRIKGIMPYQFISAANAAPGFEPQLEARLFEAAADMAKLEGTTGILVDMSASMNGLLSERGSMKRIDAACGLAMIFREVCDDVIIYAFSGGEARIPPRHGFALEDAVRQSMQMGITNIGHAVEAISKNSIDRLFVITDEQSADAVHRPSGPQRCYIINVGTYQNAIGFGNWIRIDGFSAATVRYVAEYEREFV